MILFNFNVATEPNDFEETDALDEIWIQNDKGVLVKVEDNNASN